MLSITRITKHLDLIAVIVASIIGLALHALGIIPEAYLISLLLLLLSLLAIHEISHSVKYDVAHETIMRIENKLTCPPSEIELIKPPDLLTLSQEFALRNQGEEWWFNICADMFRSQDLFDRLLKPSIQSQKSSKIVFVLKHSMKDAWEKDIQPKIEKCKGKEKIQPPLWRDIEENIAFRMIDVSSEKEVKEAFLTVWGEPFMMEHRVEKEETRMPRHVLYVRSHSELIPRLKDIFMRYKLMRE
ncbi:MAG: hypothetical protein HY929_01525 [Euryarchaeota archaeon]|nr:hypothetical protein [Euryarchaeota archaeon]